MDGFSERGGAETAFEFLGCLFHDCLLCFHPCDVCLLRGVTFCLLRGVTFTFRHRHVVTEQKLDKLKSVYSMQIVLMREHDWTEMKKTGVKGFLLEFDPPEPL